MLHNIKYPIRDRKNAFIVSKINSIYTDIEKKEQYIQKIKRKIKKTKKSERDLLNNKLNDLFNLIENMRKQIKFLIVELKTIKIKAFDFDEYFDRIHQSRMNKSFNRYAAWSIGCFFMIIIF